ncbi:transcription initiation factor TFIID subunit 11 [Typha angustifolia]|uniref:transcription initiation factor TFIID subunit 11 n=1 Tax=Typha angustifolia TaxID=59011 RepID=UPI003C2EFB19
MKDPFEAAVEEQESPPESPVPAEEEEVAAGDAEADEEEVDPQSRPASAAPPPAAGGAGGKGKEEEDDEEEENMEVELDKLPSRGDPDKLAKMQAILSQFTEEQMSRYESFRRSGFQKANMRRLLTSITGSQKISMPTTIVVSGIAKMFVGELIETGKVVMTERKENGPIRPCHVREAYRRLKLEGKIPKRSVPRLFH